MNEALPIICLMGATATGKTDLAIDLYQHYPVEIISVDSAMVYRGMDIGTAKPTAAELQIAPHHLIDVCEPEENYSAGRFREEALDLIDKIQQKGRIPLLVGGTMLYFHTLQQGVAKLPTANKEIRETLSKQAEKIGWDGMHKKLEKIDAKIASQLHPNDSQRIQRALEVYKITGKPLSELQAANSSSELAMPCLNIILEPEDRGHLHQRIAQRFSQMLSRSFIDEVKTLQQRPGLHPELPSIRTVGYRQVWAYLSNEISHDEMVEQGIVATRQLAKRQLTWLRRWKSAHRFYFESSAYKASIHELLKKEIFSETAH